MYVILVGLLVFDETRKFDMFIGIGLVLVGIFNIIVSCMRDTIPGEENSNLNGDKNADKEYGTVDLTNEQINYNSPPPNY